MLVVGGGEKELLDCFFCRVKNSGVFVSKATFQIPK